MAIPGPGQTVDRRTFITKLIKQYLEQNPVTKLPTLNVDHARRGGRARRVSDQVKFVKSTDWRFIGSQGQPTFTNSWVSFGAPYANAAFMHLPDGFVQLHGMIKSGTLSSSAFTLPPGFRPAATPSSSCSRTAPLAGSRSTLTAPSSPSRLARTSRSGSIRSASRPRKRPQLPALLKGGPLATDATGSPTPLGIPKFNTSADAPSGLGGNARWTPSTR
jgi:hypothetical protein